MSSNKISSTTHDNSLSQSEIPPILDAESWVKVPTSSKVAFTLADQPSSATLEEVNLQDELDAALESRRILAKKIAVKDKKIALLKQQLGAISVASRTDVNFAFRALISANEVHTKAVKDLAERDNTEKKLSSHAAQLLLMAVMMDDNTQVSASYNECAAAIKALPTVNDLTAAMLSADESLKQASANYAEAKAAFDALQPPAADESDEVFTLVINKNKRTEDDHVKRLIAGKAASTFVPHETPKVPRLGM